MKSPNVQLVGNPLRTVSVIVTLVPGAKLPPEFKKWARADKLDIINGQVLDLPENVLKQLAKYPDVFRIHDNRPIGSSNYRTSLTVGADVARNTLGYTGSGIGIAIIDSGISSWHDDLTKGGVNKTYPYGDQRVSKFVDFVGGQNDPVRRQRPRHARRRHHRRQRLRQQRREGRHRTEGLDRFR